MVEIQEGRRNDKGEVAQGGTFNISITLSANAASNLAVAAHFDWNGDGIFETEEPVTVEGTVGIASVTVPEWATMEKTRMRLRVNSNGLDLAEDEVTGFIYDFHIKVVEPQERRTVTVGVNSWDRGAVELSQVAEDYVFGTTLTAKATAYGNGAFVCWKEEGVVVSTSAEYTFTVDHNVNLKAYFTPNTNEASYPTCIAELEDAADITVAQNGDNLVATAGCEVKSITLYTVDAAAVAKANGATLNIAGIKEGLYIANVITDKGYRNVKIYLNK